MTDQYLATRRAFDGIAAEYDGALGNNALIQDMRTQVMHTIERAFPPGARLLDLGCGTGVDAHYLAGRGYAVTALDASPAMVARANERLRRAGLDACAVNVPLQELARLTMDSSGAEAMGFDGAYSNFGVLNCLPELRAVSAALAARLRPGGLLVCSVIGRYCPWELAFYLLRGNVSRARARLARGPVPVPLSGETVWTRYYSPREFARELAPSFTARSLRALALFAPPPYLAHWAARKRPLYAALARADRLLGDKPLLRGLGDHFVMVLAKT